MVHFRSNHCILVSVAVSLLSQVLQATPGLVLPVERTTGLGCIPEGRTVSYVCTVTDPLDPPVASTVWQGTALNCPSASDTTNNRIILSHNQFQSGGNAGVCGGLSAMSIGFSRNEYTSRLILTASNELNGMTVICSLSGIFIAGNDTVIVGASSLPPLSVMVEVTSSSSFTFSWIPPSDTSNVGGYLFNVTGEDCGCVSMKTSADTTNVLCSDWTVSGQTCSFEVRAISEDCGFTSDSVALAISLRVPSSPTGLQVMSMYNQYGSTEYIEVDGCGTLRCEQETTPGISIGVFIVLGVNKWRRSENITLQTETEMIPPPVIYEEPNDIKPDPFTQENVAYELVKPN
ncbi:uncharacterized protein LOC135349189 [Halichondria panicea]|uniref:uncharacterized protein LOC135349189 n=1 Tax=Halichondria panicea TaxID=6063 RepID=UPI00312BB2D4